MLPGFIAPAIAGFDAFATEYTTAGDFSVPIPDGATSVIMEAIASGGAGGTGGGDGDGGGGGGAAYSRTNYSSVAGLTALHVHVPAAIPHSVQTTGGHDAVVRANNVSGAVLCYAKAGRCGAINGVGGNAPGGVASAGIGDVKYSGGRGQTGNGGGGGSAAGINRNGNNGTSEGGVSPGYPAGAGGQPGAPGSAGGAFGGGGGPAAPSGRGYVKLNWDGVPIIVGDPYFYNVNVLMHGDGADGGTNFIDVKGHTVIRNGTTITTSTAQKQFGTASIYCIPSTLGRLQVQNITRPSFSDFTIEAWVRPNVAQNNPAIASFETQGNNEEGVFGLNQGVMQFKNAVYFFGGQTFTGIWGVPVGVWTHVAWVREAPWLSMFVNGIFDSKFEMDRFGSYAHDFQTTNLWIANLGSQLSRPFNGWIDDFRFSLLARYPWGVNFTPPAAAFKDF